MIWLYKILYSHKIIRSSKTMKAKTKDSFRKHQIKIRLNKNNIILNFAIISQFSWQQIRNTTEKHTSSKRIKKYYNNSYFFNYFSFSHTLLLFVKFSYIKNNNVALKPVKNHYYTYIADGSIQGNCERFNKRVAIPEQPLLL